MHLLPGRSTHLSPPPAAGIPCGQKAGVSAPSQVFAPMAVIVMLGCTGAGAAEASAASATRRPGHAASSRAASPTARAHTPSLRKQPRWSDRGRQRSGGAWPVASAAWTYCTLGKNQLGAPAAPAAPSASQAASKPRRTTSAARQCPAGPRSAAARSTATAGLRIAGRNRPGVRAGLGQGWGGAEVRQRSGGRGGAEGG